MLRLERRLALLEESQSELALRLYWAVNSPSPITERLLEAFPQLADLTAPAAKADPA